MKIFTKSFSADSYFLILKGRGEEKTVTVFQVVV
jgi:hypothetical protein